MISNRHMFESMEDIGSGIGKMARGVGDSIQNTVIPGIKKFWNGMTNSWDNKGAPGAGTGQPPQSDHVVNKAQYSLNLAKQQAEKAKNLGFKSADQKDLASGRHMGLGHVTNFLGLKDPLANENPLAKTTDALNQKASNVQDMINVRKSALADNPQNIQQAAPAAPVTQALNPPVGPRVSNVSQQDPSAGGLKRISNPVNENPNQPRIKQLKGQIQTPINNMRQAAGRGMIRPNNYAGLAQDPNSAMG